MKYWIIFLFSFGLLFGATPIPFSALTTQNNVSVASALNTLNSTGTLTPYLTNFMNSLSGQSDTVINHAVTQLDPSVFSGIEEVQTQVAGLIASLFHRKLFCPWLCEEQDFWIQPFGNWMTEDSIGQEVGLHANTYGFAMGFDQVWRENWTVGFGVVYDNSFLNWHRSRGHVVANCVYGSLYLNWSNDYAYLGASAVGGGDFFHTSRHIDLLTDDQTAKGDPKGYELMGRLAGAAYWGNTIVVSPYFNLDYLFFRQFHFTEKGAGGFDFNVAHYISQTLRSEAGFSFRYLNDCYNDICFTPYIGISGVGYHPIQRRHFRTSFVDTSILFSTEGWDHNWNLISPSAGFEISKNQYSLSVEYKAEIGHNFFSQKGKLRYDYRY